MTVPERPDLPHGWRPPSRLMQRLASDLAALGWAWRQLPMSLRLLLIAAACRAMGLPLSGLHFPG